jgi:hypothetical protein
LRAAIRLLSLRGTPLVDEEAQFVPHPALRAMSRPHYAAAVYSISPGGEVTSTLRPIFAVWLVSACVSGTALAHHSANLTFDPSRSIEIRGEVVEWRFKNPHTLMVVDGVEVVGGVDSPQGVQRWEIESSAAAGLRARGIDENTFRPGDRVRVRGNPARNAASRRANAFGGDAGFFREDGTRFETPAARALPAPVAAKGTGVQRLAGVWRSPPQPYGASSPLALNAAGKAAVAGYDQKLSPANTCEAMSIPDVFNAPYLVTIEVAPQRIVVRNQAYNVERTIPLDGKPAPADPAGRFGTVRGRVQDGKLVIDSDGYPASRWGLGAATQIQGAGTDIPSSTRKAVSETFSVSDDGLTLIYQYTVSDAEYLAQPFSHRVEMARQPDGLPVYPYDCDKESAAQFSRD